MSILDEDRIDFELLESLVAHIDEAHPLPGGGSKEAGAILVFLPGESRLSAVRALWVERGSGRRPADAGPGSIRLWNSSGGWPPRQAPLSISAALPHP